MDEAFVTQGLTADRYLKATDLIHRFENEVQREIQRVCGQIIETNPELFDKEVTFKPRVFAAGYSQTLATIRTEFDMDRENAEGVTPKLNIALEWIEPDDPDEGSLCYVLYKIQHGSEARFTTVEERTRAQDDWAELRFGEDQWPHHAKEAPGTVYIPVENGSQITASLQTLKEHFSQEYAIKLRG